MAANTPLASQCVNAFDGNCSNICYAYDKSCVGADLWMDTSRSFASTMADGYESVS